MKPRALLTPSISMFLSRSIAISISVSMSIAISILLAAAPARADEPGGASSDKPVPIAQAAPAGGSDKSDNKTDNKSDKKDDWRKLLAEAVEAFKASRIGEAIEHGDAARLADGGDNYETNKWLAQAVFAEALMLDNAVEMSAAVATAELCIKQTEKPGPSSTYERLSARLTCLSVAARAHHHIGNLARAHDIGEECIAQADMLRGQMPGEGQVRGLVEFRSRHELHRRLCERVVNETERTGYEVLGGTWWKYVVVTAQAEYAFRYLFDEPGRRLDGWQLELSVGYPHLRVGNALLRLEAVARMGWLSEYGGSNLLDLAKPPEDVLAAQVGGLGGRFLFTIPTRWVTVDFGAGIYGMQLSTRATDPRCQANLENPTMVSCTKVAERHDWAPEFEAILRWGTPEWRERYYSMSFDTFFAISYAFGWQNPTTIGIGCTPKECTDYITPNETVNSLALRLGISLRFRFGEVKPY